MNPEQYTNREQSIGWQVLSREIARSNPDLYKTGLLTSLGQGTAYSWKAWDSLRQRGCISSDRLIIDPNQAISITRKLTERSLTTITIGAVPWSEDLKRRAIFEDEQFNYQKEKRYIFSHELAHVFFANSQQGGALHRFYNNVIIKSRREGDKGFTGLGGLEFYKNKKNGGPDTQALEDVVELINMYLVDPDYLNRYLSYLSDDKYQQSRIDNSLVSLGSGSQESIFQIIMYATFSHYLFSQ